MVPGLMQANFKRLEHKDPVAAALASVWSSLPLSETTPIPGFEKITNVANATVKAWRSAETERRRERCGFGADVPSYLGQRDFRGPYGKWDASAWAHFLEWEPDWVSKEPTPLKEQKEPEGLQRVPSPRMVAPKPSCVE